MSTEYTKQGGGRRLFGGRRDEGPDPEVEVRISAAEERAQLEHTVSAGKAAARQLTHARILLLADTSQNFGHGDEDIVSALGTSLRTVERVRQRLVTEGFQAALDHRPQPPRPDKIKIKGNVEQKLLHLACSEPPEGRCHWTLNLLCDELVALGLVRTVSTETVRQALKKTRTANLAGQPLGHLE